MYCLFQLASLFQNLSSTPSHTLTALCFAPKGNSKYFAGREQILQPNSRAKFSLFSTLPTGSNELLSKLILNPESASNQAKIQLKICHLVFCILAENKGVVCKQQVCDLRVVCKQQVCDLPFCAIPPLKLVTRNKASFCSSVNQKGKSFHPKNKKVRGQWIPLPYPSRTPKETLWATIQHD